MIEPCPISTWFVNDEWPSQPVVAIASVANRVSSFSYLPASQTRFGHALGQTTTARGVQKQAGSKRVSGQGVFNQSSKVQRDALSRNFDIRVARSTFVGAPAKFRADYFGGLSSQTSWVSTPTNFGSRLANGSKEIGLNWHCQWLSMLQVERPRGVKAERKREHGGLNDSP